MAKPSWLNLSPASGSGSGSITNSASAHTGRVARSGTVSVTGFGVTAPATYTVTQSPKAEYVTFDGEGGVAVQKAGGNITITGKTNSTKLAFSLGSGGNLPITLPAAYSANGTSTNNNANVTGDPGAVAEFPFAIELEIAANTTVDELVKNLIVTANGGQGAQVVISQAAGDAYIEVTPTSITIPQAGTGVNVAVSTNTTWTAA